MEWKVNIDDIQGARLERAKVEALRKITEELEEIAKFFKMIREELMEYE